MRTVLQKTEEIIMQIAVTVRGIGPTDKVASHIHQVLKDQLNASPWELTVKVKDDVGRTIAQHDYSNRGVVNAGRL